MMEKSLISGLISLGLREKEAVVYGELARLGEATASALAKATGIHVRSVYDSLDSLSAKGLVAYLEKEGAKVFSVTGGGALVTMADERKRTAEELAELVEKSRSKVVQPTVRILRGREGAKALFADTLTVRKPINFYAGGMQGSRMFVKYYYPVWNKKREALGIPVKMLFVDTPEVRAALGFGAHYWQSRPLPKTVITDVVWWLYGNKMAIVFWRDEPLIILIEDANLAKTYKSFFNIMWRAT